MGLPTKTPQDPPSVSTVDVCRRKDDRRVSENDHRRSDNDHRCSDNDHRGSVIDHRGSKNDHRSSAGNHLVRSHRSPNDIQNGKGSQRGSCPTTGAGCDTPSVQAGASNDQASSTIDLRIGQQSNSSSSQGFVNQPWGTSGDPQDKSITCGSNICQRTSTVPVQGLQRGHRPLPSTWNNLIHALKQLCKDKGRALYCHTGYI